MKFLLALRSSLQELPNVRDMTGEERELTNFKYHLVPSKAPLNVKASNLTSTSIQVEWEQIPRHFVHGNLLGYKVSFVATDRFNKRLWNETSVDQSTTTAVITNLRKYTKYMVSVEGFTSKGSGIESKSVAVTTAEDG